MKSQWRILATAIMFMTRIPVGNAGSGDPDDLAASTQYFPLIGVIIGVGVGLIYWLSQLVWSNEIAVVIAMISAVLLTGGFHEDGLADFADSTGAWTTERKLEVMRDSRIGTYGGLALLLALTLTCFSLIDIANASTKLHSSVFLIYASLVVAHVLGRWSSLVLIYTTQYARNDTNNKAFTEGVNQQTLLFGSLITLGVLLVCAIVAVQSVLVSFIVACFVIAISRSWFLKSIDGITGDCLGAANKLVEISVYLSFAAIITL